MGIKGDSSKLKSIFDHVLLETYIHIVWYDKCSRVKVLIGGECYESSYFGRWLWYPHIGGVSIQAKAYD